MRKIFLVVAALVMLLFDLSAQQCWPSINTQADINNFPANYPGCKYINSVNLNTADVFNLDSFYAVESIDYLTISGTSLSNLNGLQNLETVFALVIRDNPKLKNIDGLSTVGNIPSSVAVINNDSLTSISGLINLDSSGYFGLEGNQLLTNLEGLNNLRIVKNIVIKKNDSLVDFGALNKLETIITIGYFDLNNKVQHMNGFENLKNTGLYGIEFVNNASLKHLPHFKKLKSATSISIKSDSLISLAGLDSLEKINGLHISKCKILEDLEGLGNLKNAGHLWIDSLNIKTLNGLNNLDSITNKLLLYDCDSLLSLDALFYLQYLETFDITENVSLTECAISAVCERISSPNAFFNVVQNNGSGCNAFEEISVSCGGLPVTVKLVPSENCDIISNGFPIQNRIVSLSNQNFSTWRTTNIDGEITFGYLDTGLFCLTLPEFPTDNWMLCQDTIWINPDTVGTTVEATFSLKPLNNCPELHTELQLPPFFRGCLVNSTISVTNQNVGGIPAENTLVGVVIPSTLEVVTTTPPVFSTSGDTLFFQTGNLNPFQTSTVNITVHTSCDTFLLGSTICLEAFGYLDNPCPPLPEASDVRVYSECLSDTTIRFTLKNILGGSTQNPHEYIIIEDEIVLMTSPFNLGPFGTMTVDVPANAATYRMEATRLEDGTLTATAREGCGGFTPGLITAFWLNTHLSDYDYDCREVVAAYDPNQKTAIPKGIGEQHLLPKNTPITYNIEFQNTGTDTAFRVLLRDVLSENLDVTTFRSLGATHPYTWEIRGGDTLEVLFQPIALPDSNVNEAASHGWFSFIINQKNDLTDGTLIENTASIIFDYNPPIITNTTFHTIGELTVGTTFAPDHQQNSLWKVSGNPVNRKAVFSSTAAKSGPQHFSLMNATGKTVEDLFFADRRFEFDRKQLPAGLYCYTITDERGKVSGGKLMLE